MPTDVIGPAPALGHSQATYTIPEAMAYLRHGRTSIEGFIKRGLLIRSLASRKVIIDGRSVETFITRTSGVRKSTR